MSQWPASLDDGSEMAGRILAKDWSTTPLGPIEGWPQPLRTALGMCLASRFPMYLYWGPERFQLYNDHGIPIMGARHPDAALGPVREVFPALWPQVGPMFDEIARTGKATFAENLRLLMDRNGFLEEAYFTWSYAPIKDENGNVVGFYTPAMETTGQVIGARRLRTLQVIAERAAGASSVEAACRAALTAFAENRPDVPCALLYLTNADGKSASLVGSCGVVEARSGAPLEVTFDTEGCILAPSAAGDALAIDGRLQVEPDPAGLTPPPRFARVLPLKHGETDRAFGYLLVGLSEYLAHEGEYRGFLELAAGAVAAVASTARAQQAARDRAEQLAALDRAKTAFFSNVSHEFRTPLTLILGPVEDAVHHAGALAGEQLELVRRNALRLSKMVNTLLDFSRIEAGRARARFVPTDLAAVTRDLASAFQSAAETAGLRLVVDCPPLLEPVFVDPEMWEEIVLNLISNAVKYTHRGEVRVRLGIEGTETVLSVTDTGVGIPAEELPRVFERFYRARSTAGRSHEGTGIGLAIVEELVKLHGGSVEVESTLGQGTTFRVHLLRGQAHLPNDRVERASTPRLATAAAAAFVEEANRWAKPDAPRAARVSGARILVVDDNADLRAYVTGILEPMYPNIETAADGQAALEAARQSPPDLVVSDVMMPRLDGFGLVRELRADERTRTVPIILLSARAGDEATVSGLASGADDYLVKPFSARELVARVRARLEIEVMRRRTIAQSEALVALEEQQRWIEMALDTMPAPLLFTEPGTGRVMFANSAANTMAGGPFPEDSGAPPFRITDERDRALPKAESPGARAASGEELRAAPIVWHTPAGRFSLLVDSKQLPEVHGHRPTVVLTMRDVSELLRTQVELEEAVRVRDEFLSIASHELKTPLTALEVQLHTLERHASRITKDTDALEWLGGRITLLRRQHERLFRLVTQLLDVTRIDEAGPLVLEDVELGEVVRGVVTELGELGDFDRAGCELQFEGDAAVGRWDRFRIEQIARSLLANALKFGAGKAITVRVTTDGETAQLVVRDEGIGISAEDQRRIFGRFERAVSAQHFGGLGLGLHIASQAAAALGGTIAVESKVGRGARFIVALPLAPRSGQDQKLPDG